eukprot:Clim_evm57s109 gene=Clim_evmTU57s109
MCIRGRCRLASDRGSPLVWLLQSEEQFTNATRATAQQSEEIVKEGITKRRPHVQTMGLLDEIKAEFQKLSTTEKALLGLTAGLIVFYAGYKITRKPDDQDDDDEHDEPAVVKAADKAEKGNATPASLPPKGTTPGKSFADATKEVPKTSDPERKRAAKLSAQGAEFYKKEKYLEAIEKYEEAEKIYGQNDPKISTLEYNKGACYQRMKEDDKAIEAYSRAVKVNDRYAKAYKRRGDLYEKKKSFKLAMYDLLNATNFGDDEFTRAKTVETVVSRLFEPMVIDETQQMMKNTSGRMRPKSMIKIYVNTFLPEDLSTLNAHKEDPREEAERKGQKLLADEDYEAALDYYRTAYKTYPNSDEIGGQLATLCFMHGLSDEAKEILNDVLSKHPKNARAMVRKATIFMSHGKTDEAMALFGKACNIGKKDWLCFFHRGQSHAEALEMPKAISDYEKAMELAPDRLEPLNQSAIANAFAKNFDKGVETLKSAMERFGDKADPYYNLAFIYGMQQKYDDAMKYFDTSIEKDSDSPFPYLYKGIILLQMGKVKEAHENYELAIKKDPENVDAYAALARVYLKQFEVQKSIECYDKAIQFSFMEPQLMQFVAAKEEVELNRHLGTIPRLVEQLDQLESQGFPDM